MGLFSTAKSAPLFKVPEKASSRVRRGRLLIEAGLPVFIFMEGLSFLWKLPPPFQQTVSDGILPVYIKSKVWVSLLQRTRGSEPGLSHKDARSRARQQGGGI